MVIAAQQRFWVSKICTGIMHIMFVDSLQILNELVNIYLFYARMIFIKVSLT